MSSLGTRQQQKERTRRAILDAALEISEETGLSALSLRQVAKRVGIVPTAFYRHFDSVDQLGMALVEESFTSLRSMLRDVRRTREVEAIIDVSVQVMVEHTRDQRGHFRFIARERVAGPALVRAEIRHQLELFQRELAADLARLPGPRDWSAEDLQVFCGLIVDLMVATAERILSAPPERADALARDIACQLRMLVVGARDWRSGTTGL